MEDLEREIQNLEQINQTQEINHNQRSCEDALAVSVSEDEQNERSAKPNEHFLDSNANPDEESQISHVQEINQHS